MYSLFVLDFDRTYDFEDPDDYGVRPSVYLIPAEKRSEVRELAYEAHRKFHEDEDCNGNCIGDYFEEGLEKNEIWWKYVGDLDVPFGERKQDYLSDYVNVTVV